MAKPRPLGTKPSWVQGEAGLVYGESGQRVGGQVELRAGEPGLDLGRFGF